MKPYVKKGANAPIPTGALEAALPEVNGELAKMQQNVVAMAFKSIYEGKLTPDLAKDLWHQMASMAELGRRLNTRNAMDGAVAAKQMAAMTAKKD